MDEIRDAYDRLDAGPGPSVGDVLVGVRRRRRRRTAAAFTGAAAAVLAVAGGIELASGGEDARPPIAAPSTSPASTTASSPSSPQAVPVELTCATDLRSMGIFDFVEEPSNGLSVAEVARRKAGDDPYVVSGTNVWLLRGDGTAYSRLGLVGQESTGYAVGTIESCDGEARHERVRLGIGHCWVDPLEVLGDTWRPLVEDQFGYGGRIPDGISGTGDVSWWSVDHDRLEYVDREGGRLDLYPTSDPRTEIGPICR